jgi:G patch domain-containing protein 1
LDALYLQIIPFEQREYSWWSRSRSRSRKRSRRSPAVHGRRSAFSPSFSPSLSSSTHSLSTQQDLAELASSRTLETSSAYASRSSAPSAAAAPPPSSAPYDPLMGLFGPLSSSTTSAAAPAAPELGAFDTTLASLIAPADSRIGMKLMRKMGWRDGQGVGPRITLRQRKKQARELGIVLPSAGEEEEGEGGEAEKHLYPPLDRPLSLVKGTSASGDRGWGLGYQPGMTLDARLRNEGGAGGGGGARQTFYEEEEEDAYGVSAGGPSRLGERERRALGAFEDDEGMDEDFDKIKRTGSGRGRGVKVRFLSLLFARVWL